MAAIIKFSFLANDGFNRLGTPVNILSRLASTSNRSKINTLSLAACPALSLQLTLSLSLYLSAKKERKVSEQILVLLLH